MLKKILFLIVFCLMQNVLAETNKPFPPFRIMDNLYYVGNDFAANYLITTSEGNIVINSGYASDVPMIEESIEKLGFKFADTKILLISHSHNDHDGGSALIKAKTHAKYMVMAPDVEVSESGGRKDFHYANDSTMFYTPTKVDHVLHDGEKVKLGGVELFAHLTPGHTKGCTTWTMKIRDKNKIYDVVMIGSVNVNPGYQLHHNPNYPNITDDFKKTFRVLKSLPCDIFLGAHGMYFDLATKYALRNKKKTNPFIDPKGYQNFILTNEKNFNDLK